MSLDHAAAAPEARAAHDAVQRAFEAFKEANDRRLAEIEAKSAADALSIEKVDRIDRALTEHKAALDRLLLREARPRLGAPPEPGADERKMAFEGYVRKGDASRLLETKDLLAGATGPEGGYLVPVETERMIGRRLAALSPIRAIATVVEVGGLAYKKPVSLGDVETAWAAEAGARTKTDPPTLALLDIPTAELYAMPAASQTLLDDSFINIDEWLAGEIEEVFAAAEGEAFVTGSGAGEPKGFLAYTAAPDATAVWGELGYIATGVAGGFPVSDPADILLDLIYAPKAGYRANGRFVMNRKTISAVRKFKDADGDYIWRPAVSAGGEPTLFGYPVTEAEHMPDVAANALAIAFGDFRRGYIVVDRMGLRVLRDPYTSKPFVLFYTAKRVGGGVQDFDAIKLLKFAVS